MTILNLARWHPTTLAFARARRQAPAWVAPGAATMSLLMVVGCAGPIASSVPTSGAPSDSPGPSLLPSVTAAPQRADGWPSVDPEAEGFDSARLAAGLDQLAAGGVQVHSLLIVRHGNIVLDAYAYPYDGSTYHDLASVTKSVTTTLIGIAADAGRLDLDAPILSFFRERNVANRTERKAHITVRQLASMTSGLDCPLGRGEDTLDRMLASQDWVQFALDLDTVAEPGTRFGYCSPGMHLLSAILTRATGQSEFEFARTNLFEPLGIAEAYWPADGAGISDGWGGLALHPRDAAKIGQLFLQQGRWNGAQIVSPAWVAAATSIQAGTDGFKSEDYGYGWWIARPSEEPMAFFRADGNGGQRILGVPGLDLLVVTTGGGFSLDEAMAFIVAAATDDWRPLPANPAGVAQLQKAVDRLRTGPLANPIPKLPAKAALLSGHAVSFPANANAIRSLRAEFNPGDAVAIVTLDAMHESPVREMVVGLDGRWYMSRAGRPIAARGRWLDESTFAIDVDEGPGISLYTLRVVVTGQDVRLEGPGQSLIGTIAR